MIITTPEAMEEFGRSIASTNKKILLNGELAAGKTTFVRGFVDGLGLDYTQVSSPTYAYLQIYDNTVVHIDMYRLNEESELIEKGLLDAIMEHDYIVIERPKWTEHYIDNEWISIDFTKDGNTRNVEITHNDSL